MEELVKTVYSLVWGQCTDIMHQKIEALDDFKTMSRDGDGMALLRAVKNVSFNFQSQKYTPQALHESKRRFYVLSQGKHATPRHRHI